MKALDEYRQHSPDEPLPPGLEARVRAAGVDYAAVPWQRVGVQNTASAEVTSFAALFNALTNYVNGPERDGSTLRTSLN